MEDFPKLTKRELDALVECNQCVRGTYAWRVRSMQKLAEKGLVSKVSRRLTGCGDAWAVSALGRKYLDKLEVAK